jgi:hypothetical protein
MGEGCGNDVVAFGLGLEDGFEVILFGDGDGFGHSALVGSFSLDSAAFRRAFE